MASPAHRLHTADDLVSLGDAATEIVRGTIVYKADPSAEHGDAQAGLASIVRQAFHRRSGHGGPVDGGS